MTDRPDWLPEPERHTGPPLSERLHLLAASVASLLLGVLGIVLLVIGTLMTASQIATLNQHINLRFITSYFLPGITMTTLAYLMRWCLRRVRPQIYKPRPPL